MKKHIDSNQWNEIKDSSKLKIAKMFNKGPESNDFFTNPGVYIPLSIGQMIEVINKYDKNESIFIEYLKHNEPCDALWKAVKEVLETNH